MFSRLVAPLHVVLHGAEICDPYDDAIERARVAQVVRVPESGRQEAASTRVPGTDVLRRTVSKLAYRGCEAGGG